MKKTHASFKTLCLLTILMMGLFMMIAHANENTLQGKVSDWAAAEVNEALALELVPKEMLADNLTENINRAEFAAIALQLHQAIVGHELRWYGGHVLDIEGNKYSPYINGAYFFSITSGTSETDHGIFFSPDLNITREQLATMLCRVVKKNKYEHWILGRDADFPLDTGNTTVFGDDYLISDYATESVYYLSKHGIIKGIDESRFAPLDTATREQAILLALRIYKAFESLPAPKQIVFTPFSQDDLVFYTPYEEKFATLQLNTHICLTGEATSYLTYPNHQHIDEGYDITTARDIQLFVTSIETFLERYSVQYDVAIWAINEYGKRTFSPYTGEVHPHANGYNECYLYIGYAKTGDDWMPIGSSELQNILSGNATLGSDTEIVTFEVSADEAGIINMIHAVYTTVGNFVS